MRFEVLEIEDILTEESPYNIRRYLILGEPEPWPEHLPVLPLTVIEASRKFHLIDGSRRLEYLRSRGKTRTEAVVFDTEKPEEVVSLIFTLHQSRIMESTMQRILFLEFARSVGCPVETITPLVGLRGHRDLQEEIKRIVSLPEEVKRFFHQKGFSYLQILSFAAYPLELLDFIVELSREVQITAQVFEELLENIHEYLQRERVTLKEFKEAHSLKEILNSEASPKQKAMLLRQYIKQLRFPFLEGVNRKIEEKINGLQLPPNIQVLWDRTLEDSALEIRVKVKDKRDLENLRFHIQWEHIIQTLQEVQELIEGPIKERIS